MTVEYRPVTELKPGFILAKDVHDQRGKRLLGAGTTLTERHLRALRMWGVSTVVGSTSLQDLGADAAVESDDPVLLQRVEQDLRPLFAQADLDHPLTKALFRRKAMLRLRSQRG